MFKSYLERVRVCEREIKYFRPPDGVRSTGERRRGGAQGGVKGSPVFGFFWQGHPGPGGNGGGDDDDDVSRGRRGGSRARTRTNNYRRRRS